MPRGFVTVTCPSCFEEFEIAAPPPEELPADLDYDCEVCCRPMVIAVWDDDGEPAAESTHDRVTPRMSWPLAPAATVDCRAACGACCIAPSISSPLPAMPFGKPAGVPCAHLDADYRCELFGKPERPAVCVSLRPEPAMCGGGREEALSTLGLWERLTRPDRAR